MPRRRMQVLDWNHICSDPLHSHPALRVRISLCFCVCIELYGQLIAAEDDVGP